MALSNAMQVKFGFSWSGQNSIIKKLSTDYLHPGYQNANRNDRNELPLAPHKVFILANLYTELPQSVHLILSK